MLILFGIAFIVIENYHKGKKAKVTALDGIDYKLAFWIGMFQLIAAIFPGTSRSGATIVGARCLVYQNGCGRIYLLSGHSGYVWSKPLKGSEVPLQVLP